MTLLPPDEQTGYADVDEALERAKYRMLSNAPVDMSLHILEIMNMDMYPSDHLYNKEVLLQTVASLAIEKRAMDDARILAQYIRLQKKGKLT